MVGADLTCTYMVYRVWLLVVGAALTCTYMVWIVGIRGLGSCNVHLHGIECGFSWFGQL